MVQNKQIVLARYPEGMPQDEDFRYEDVEVQEPKEGQVVVETAYISVDPYMRNRMKPSSDSYVENFQLDEPIVGFTVGQVKKSNNDDFNEGDIVTGMMPWATLPTVDGKTIRKVPPLDVPPYLYLGVLGMTGQTAYNGLLEIGKPKEGETVVVSAASGAVGAVVGQVAKIKGAKVVGIAGGEEKNRYLVDELGFDHAVDYKRDDYADKLAEAVPDGVDVYFENVGGTVANEVFKHLNTFARIPVCGSISKYNDEEVSYEPAIQPILIKNQALMQGFLVVQFEKNFESAGKQLAQWVKEGKIKTKTSVADGIDQVPHAFRNLFTGENFGKQVIKVSNILD
ncbi:putative zinc-binding dehydrogenase [Staphylococcus piscifermentans]|uniref:NADP-dependent oxidoreductase n=1 Tax=Staphylococcus piscifermentans TaxID=70258 RepID=A0A239TR87_9STAP|nr:NADP-dependent oxidoreductase [Staphylococcus piscifermentans]RTX85550.1 NADP-dependent oxidoreductase [Staphylococcus piscifermentans]GEP84630.1 NADP-dependent oxidoreductase [Staphylococcus piscifermentans]SNV00481.1 putative zinc-binding dehydrogenase [Staphylococcus piscifermentans]